MANSHVAYFFHCLENGMRSENKTKKISCKFVRVRSLHKLVVRSIAFVFILLETATNYDCFCSWIGRFGEKLLRSAQWCNFSK